MLYNVLQGNPIWSREPDAYISSKCDGGSDPCGSTVSSGYRIDGGRRVCNAQCYTLEADRNCSTSPVSAVESALAKDSDGALGRTWTQWLWLLFWVLGALLFLSFVQALMCPASGSKGSP